MSASHRKFLADDDDLSLEILYGLDRALAAEGWPASGPVTKYGVSLNDWQYRGDIAPGYYGVIIDVCDDAHAIDFVLDLLDANGTRLDQAAALVQKPDSVVAAVYDVLRPMLAHTSPVAGTWAPTAWNFEFVEQVQTGFMLAWEAHAPVTLKPLTWGYSKFTYADKDSARIDFVPPAGAAWWGFIKYTDLHREVVGSIYDSAILDRDWLPTGNVIAHAETPLVDDETPASMGGWLADMLLAGRPTRRGTTVAAHPRLAPPATPGGPRRWLWDKKP